jgi:hypothetical protein
MADSGRATARVKQGLEMPAKGKDSIMLMNCAGCYMCRKSGRLDKYQSAQIRHSGDLIRRDQRGLGVVSDVTPLV